MLKTILWTILEFLWAKLWPIAQKAINKIKRQKPQEDATKKLEEANKNGAPIEEKVKLEDDFINS